MKTLLAIIFLLLGFLAYAGEDEGVNNASDLEVAIAHEKSSTKWEDDNKYLAQSTRSTSSIGEDESAVESDQVEYVVIEE